MLIETAKSVPLSYFANGDGNLVLVPVLKQDELGCQLLQFGNNMHHRGDVFRYLVAGNEFARYTAQEFWGIHGHIRHLKLLMWRAAMTFVLLR